jgi:glutathione S-transferase
MNASSITERLPRPLRRHVLAFEAAIEDAVAAFARELPEGVRVLDAGAGEGQYARWFTRQRYCGVDLAIGDAAWNYGRLDVLADLTALRCT